jgi:phosphate transport system permease protein
VVRTVVLPFGRGGIVGGTMLALGRALGETAAVLIIISPAYGFKASILSAGQQTFSALIAGNFGNATSAQLSALLAAGFVLFLMTLVVNFIAANTIRRSRSGASTEL